MSKAINLHSLREVSPSPIPMSYVQLSKRALYIRCVQRRLLTSHSSQVFLRSNSTRSPSKPESQAYYFVIRSAHEYRKRACPLSMTQQHGPLDVLPNAVLSSSSSPGRRRHQSLSPHLTSSPSPSIHPSYPNPSSEIGLLLVAYKPAGPLRCLSQAPCPQNAPPP